MGKTGLTSPPMVIGYVGVLTTLAINPWYALDPINLPKMFILTTGAATLVGWTIFQIKIGNKPYLPIVALSIFFVLSLLASFFTNIAPWYQQLWGTWGRSTGLIAYLAFIVMMVSALLVSSNDSTQKIRVLFERLGYFISLYTLIQLMEIDPINWSQKAMVATLGNINFMSSFLGLAAISYSCRLLLEKLSISSKLFFLSLTSLNLYLILISQSIQGVGVFFAGLTLLLAFKIRHSHSLLKSLIFLVSTIVIGIIVFVGTLGLGPLSVLRQNTVLFRLDYWQAGINMLIANPINGVGIDSYGDYYREYRTLEAVTRTGPQRVTNTAHNIFLDIFSGAGIFAGLFFTLIMLLTAKAIFSALKGNFVNVDFISFSAMWLGFMVFLLISINQIGVGVWGFIFTGLVNGFVIRSRIDKGKIEGAVYAGKRKTERSISENLKNLGSAADLKSPNRALQFTVSGVLTIAVGTLSLIPNVADARFVSATRSSNLDQAIKVVNSPGIQDFHIERLISALAEAGRSKESLELAQLLTKQNPQSWPAWVAIVSSGIATRDQKVRAANELFRLDPNNELVKKEINAALFP
jgi:O-antigen ligase